MTRITEQRDVQNQLIHHLKAIGWTFIARNDLPAWRNHDESQPFLPTILRSQFARLNRWPADDGSIDEVIRRLRLLPASLAGNERFLHALRGHWTVYDATQQREHNLALIDYTDLSANTYHFTEELWFQDRDRRRLDLVLYINGLPLVVVENKSPRLEDPGLEGFKQVQETYTQHIPEFIKYPIPFVVCASRLEYGPTWNADLKAFYKWKVNGRDYGLEALSTTFFARDQLLRLLRDYTIFYRMDDALQKYLLRPHQMRAAEKIVARTVAAQADPTEVATGLEAHTQGSGKTLTMIVTASLLRRQAELRNPTVLFVVDRLELETQMLQNLEAFGLDALHAQSKEHLRQLLVGDTRGVIVTTIHKFDGLPKDLLTRRNVVVLVDEAHRSQEGNLGIFLRAALPNALHFGFTGTPIDRGKVGRGTYALFGHTGDPNGIQDEYTLNESIEDGTTLPLYYTLAPTEIWVDKLKLETKFATLLEDFWQVVDDEGAASQEALSRLLQRADKLLAVLKSPQRISAIAAHIAQHYQENVLPLGFKSLVVAPDREACALYKQQLDHYLPKAWSVVVYSQDPKHDTPLMQQHYLDDDAEKAVRKAFRDPAREPKLLIVTQKLLTGFDAPVAYAMYLDKPLKDHTLLQAIARVNRPYSGKKSGLIVDYIGIFQDLQRALAGQQATVNRGLIDYATLRPRFADLLAQLQSLLAPVEPERVDNRIYRIIDYFWPQERRQHFFHLYTDLQTVYEILSPDPFLRDYIDDYLLVSDIYHTVRTEFDPQREARRLTGQFLHKTEGLIREHVAAYAVASPLPLYPINRHLADVIANDNLPERVQVINLQRSINAHIEQHLEEQPYLISISQEVERVIEQLHQQQISVRTALDALATQTQRIITTGEERANSPLDKLAFALRMVLRGANLTGLDNPLLDELAATAATYLQQHSGWQHNPDLARKVRLELYRRLMPHATQPPTVATVNQIKTVVDELLEMHKITL